MSTRNSLALLLRFLLVGGSGFLIDASITYLLNSFGAKPWLARIPAIVLAMTYTFVANRKFTYNVDTLDTTSEFIRYITVASVMALLNYLIYLVMVSKGVLPVVAVTFATAFNTGLSFHLYRIFVFRKLGEDQRT